MTIRLVCIDVDGTLLGSNGGVLPAVWSAAERARAAGIHLAICSGRPAFGITREYAQRLDPGGWHVFQNGASVIHLSTHRSLSTELAPETVAMLIKRARETGRLLEVYTDEDYTAEGNDIAVARTHASLLGVPFSSRPFEALQGPRVRAQWLVPMAESSVVLAEPHPGLQVTPSTAPLMAETLFVNLTREGVDKSSAVRAIAGEYGVPLEQVMYIGDGPNDVTAMRVVGCAIAMGNAEPEALEVARRTVAHVDEGGLVEALDIATAA